MPRGTFSSVHAERIRQGVIRQRRNVVNPKLPMCGTCGGNYAVFDTQCPSCALPYDPALASLVYAVLGAYRGNAWITVPNGWLERDVGLHEAPQACDQLVADGFIEVRVRQDGEGTRRYLFNGAKIDALVLEARSLRALHGHRGGTG